jgi:type I restriction-modification system DNA methylase subunit
LISAQSYIVNPEGFTIPYNSQQIHGISNESLTDIQEKDRYDVVLANPPFGGKERAEIQQNLPIKTGETASLFLQHFIKILKAGGNAGVVIKNTRLAGFAILHLKFSVCNSY